MALADASRDSVAVAPMTATMNSPGPVVRMTHFGKEVHVRRSMRGLIVGLMLAGTTTGCSWLPSWGTKKEQGLSWATPDVSKTYGANQISAERGGSFAPRTEMPK